MIRYISLLLFIGLALGQSYVDPLEAARLAKSAAEKAQAELNALAKELGLDYEKAIVLKTAVIYLRNGERIEGDVFEIGAIDQYIVVRTERENRKRIRYRDINYILHNNNGLTDYLQAAGKEPEPKPEPVIWDKSPELDVIEKTPTISKVKKQQFRSREFFDNIIASSSILSRESGLYLYLSNPNFQFRSSEFKRVIDKGIIEKRFGIGLGIEYRMAQHLFGVLTSTVTWDHSVDGLIDTSSITFSGSDLYYARVSPVSLTLNNMTSITPSIGFGYQSTFIEKLGPYFDFTSRLNTSGYYFFGEVKAGFTRGNSNPVWKSLGKNNGAGIGLQYKLSIALEERQWSQTNVYFYLFGEWALYPPSLLLILAVFDL